MEEEIIKIIENYINETYIDMVVSNSSDTNFIKKIKVRPIRLKNAEIYQVTSYQGAKVFHKNCSKQELKEEMIKWFCGIDVQAETKEIKKIKFKQAVIRTTTQQVNVLVSKKGKITTKATKLMKEMKKPEMEHNRTKKYILEEGITVPFLVDLGVMTTEGRIVAAKYDKYKQINRFLEFVEDVLDELPKDRELTILDFGCGKSYLTFSLYYYLKNLKGYPIHIIGLDLKPDVIHTCNELAEKYQYENLKFYLGDIAQYEGVQKVDMVVTLHACDTATDYALYKAIDWDAKVILSVPCCQKELNRQIKCKELEGILEYGILKERAAALFTDGIRAQLLQLSGYRTQILEFIDMEHTPKNLLIRAIKDQKKGKAEWSDYEKLVNFLGVTPTLGELLKEKSNNRIG
ncbi:class I SAM-dependent methyltransferase [Anaeromicropila populeti]|uniref:Methyltransferase domain-containing protein n=1 Tax=Anaeromicropila populeti TaxID=37658 RepID=A0A1I6I888_9FIRM|nr:SAM-dependent methyltransferase [Anaeromicropila populeti]SFR62933.1 Methyltransferase domain-containing protein [Anaeromicropila populeti]